VQLYSLQRDGYHTALTAAQVAELFHAGRLVRDDPCKATGNKKWRTIDELFPLLKYELPAGPRHQIDNSRRSRSIIVAASIVAVLVVSSAVWLTLHGFRLVANPVATSQRGLIADAGASSNNTASVQQSPSSVSHVRSTYQSNVQTDFNSVGANTRLEQERVRREQLQRERADLADRLRRENQRQQAEASRAAGRNILLPLDETKAVQVDGSSVNVKVHDNDVVSFDVWINGAWRRNMKKERGISGSGTDEALIYSSGRARLYYVWEISGKLNYCLLRVRGE
jgi:hypothetical protein